MTESQPGSRVTAAAAETPAIASNAEVMLANPGFKKRVSQKRQNAYKAHNKERAEAECYDRIVAVCTIRHAH